MLRGKTFSGRRLRAGSSSNVSGAISHEADIDIPSDAGTANAPNPPTPPHNRNPSGEPAPLPPHHHRVPSHQDHASSTSWAHSQPSAPEPPPHQAAPLPSKDFFKWTRRRREVVEGTRSGSTGDRADPNEPPVMRSRSPSNFASMSALRLVRKGQGKSFAARRRDNPIAPHSPAGVPSRRLDAGGDGNPMDAPISEMSDSQYHDHDRHGRHPQPAPLRYSNADVRVSGWLVKRGKRLGSKVERYLELNGSTLTNARSERGRPTWAVNVRGCKVLSGPNREIVFKVNKNFSSFFAPNDHQHHMWVEALQAVSATVTEFYDFGKLIGRGAYSEVFLARDQLRNELCAIKVLQRIDGEHCKLIDRELQVLRMLNSNSLVRTCDIFDTPAQTFVVMEYLAGGELLELITDNDHLSERTAKHILRQVLTAVLYLHGRGIVHRDVKPENILLASNQSPLPRIKLTDFGLSRVVSTPGSDAPDNPMQSQCGTAFYLAPEIANNLSYGKAVDLWACGVVCFVMLAGKFPFYGDSDEKFMRRLRAGVQFPSKEWRGVSKSAKSLIRGLLDPNPETRLTAQQALDHRWLQEESDLLSTSSKPHVGTARTLEELQFAAKNESLSLQLAPYAPVKHRRDILTRGGAVAEEDDVLRTEELTPPVHDEEAFGKLDPSYNDYDSESEMAPSHRMDPPLNGAHARARSFGRRPAEI